MAGGHLTHALQVGQQPLKTYGCLRLCLPPRPQPSGYYYLAAVRSLRHVAALLLEVLSDKLGDQCPRGSQQVAL